MHDAFFIVYCIAVNGFYLKQEIGGSQGSYCEYLLLTIIIQNMLYTVCMCVKQRYLSLKFKTFLNGERIFFCWMRKNIKNVINSP